MKQFYGAAIAALAIMILLFAAARVTRKAADAHELVPWRSDLESAKVEANQQHKLLLIYLTASWCPPCQQMKHTTWADADVAKTLEKYIAVKVDVDEHPDLARRYDQANTVPMFVVAGSDGDSRRERAGYMDATEFINWLTQ